MKNNYVYVVAFSCVPDHYTVCATTNINKAVKKKIESDYYNIEIWLDDKKVGTYGDLNEHSQRDYNTVFVGVIKIINSFESR